jgi:hypothetical protein
MKTLLAISLFLAVGMFGTATLNSKPVTHHPACCAKECSDCGCSGPDKGGKCPDEKGKTCNCKK